MTRRHDALIPLTHDHHHALHNARLLRKAADSGDTDRVDAARSFVQFFREQSVMHFREEEEQIFPLVINHPECPREAIVRILTDHVRLHALVDSLGTSAEEGSVEGDLMRELADLLQAHIRYEEDTLFPAIEELVPSALGQVSLAERRRGPIADREEAPT